MTLKTKVNSLRPGWEALGDSICSHNSRMRDSLYFKEIYFIAVFIVPVLNPLTILFKKSVLLQKKENEGFGFVLRGAKAQTPIEEFSPTPAFPALQYLESVDEGGVAWRAGLRMGDFLIEVNGQNVVKVGHRQVVNMIRQGGSSLMVKVVMVARNPEMEEAPKKKVPPQTKRLTPSAIALRSKSMTSELEEMGGWVADEERGSLHPPTMKLSRSLSVPGPEDIPPPPDTSAPEPPLSSGGRRPEPIHSGPPAHFLTHAQTGMAPPVSRAGSRRDSADAIRKGGAKMGVLRRGYSNATPPSNITSAAPKQAIAKAAGRRGGGKGPLLKQPKVEDGGSRVMDKSSIPIPTIIVKAPSTSSSGRSSQGSSIDAEPPAELDQDKESESINPSVSRPSPPSISTKRERKRFRDSGRKSASFFYSSEEDVLDETATNQTERTSPRLRSSKSIDEGLFAGDSLNDQGLSMPPAFGLPQYASPHTHRHAQATTFIHPLTGKVLDPASPLGLALAARERALKDDRRTCREERHFGRQMSSSGVFPSTVSMTRSRAGELEKEAREGLRVRFTEDRQEDVQYQSQYHNQYQNQYQTQDHNQYHDQYQWDWQHEHERGEVMLKSMSSCVQKPPQTNQQPSSRRQSLLYVGLMVLPPPAPSVDVDDEFVFSDPLPPPLQFANGSDHGLQGSPTYTQQQQHLQQPQQKDLHNQHIQQQDELQLQSQQQSSVTIEEQQLSHQPSAIVHPFLFPPSPLIPPPQLCPKIPASNITLPSTTSNSPSQPLLHHLSQAATPQITSNTYTPHTLRRSGQGSNIEPFPNSAAVTPHSPHIPQAGDSAASSLTSYDSEVANLTQLLQSPLTPPAHSLPLTDSFFPSTPPPLFSPSHATASNPLMVSHCFSPTQFLSGGSSPSCVNYPPFTLPPSTRPFATKALPFWSKYDVADWLTYLNLGEHRERFLDNEIDGSHLPSLTKEDFLDLGVSRVGHRMNIERALRSLTNR
uniref:SH3 and multiple ankyrin repeat domains 1 n=1 Tax=Denticeps clupeoides TaxID=299321 RepID=A0AAY4C0Z5_9TELE